MKQSRAMSLVESVANVIVGYGVAVVTQILIFPIFGLHTTLAQNLKMGAVHRGQHRAVLRPAAAVRKVPLTRCGTIIYPNPAANSASADLSKPAATLT